MFVPGTVKFPHWCSWSFSFMCFPASEGRQSGRPPANDKEPFMHCNVIGRTSPDQLREFLTATQMLHAPWT